jgi:hypothetical protein
MKTCLNWLLLLVLLCTGWSMQDPKKETLTAHRAEENNADQVFFGRDDFVSQRAVRGLWR